MKSGIRLLLAAIALTAWTATSVADKSFSEILRNAALANGLLPAGQLFNDTDQHLAAVGRTFFESENLSLNGRIACRTCHLDEFGSGDGLPNAVGIFGEGEGPARAFSDGKIVPRNTLPLWGRGGQGFDVFFWDGKVDFSGERPLSQFGTDIPSSDPLLTAVHLPPVEIREMIDDDADLSRFKTESPQQAQHLYSRILARLVEAERAAMEELASGLEKQVTELAFRDVARSIAAFIRSEFRLRDTRFHRFVFGDGQLDPQEVRGGLIFYGKGKCVNCHTGPYFTDFRFHAIPIPQLGFGRNGFGIDYGRFNVTFDPEDLYRFRTPPLINVTSTAPYGHSGSLDTLQGAIVAHYDPLRLLNTNKMNSLARHEQFKRMAAVGDDFKLLSTLTDSEAELVIKFLETLRFQSNEPR